MLLNFLVATTLLIILQKRKGFKTKKYFFTLWFYTWNNRGGAAGITMTPKKAGILLGFRPDEPNSHQD